MAPGYLGSVPSIVSDLLPLNDSVPLTKDSTHMILRFYSWEINYQLKKTALIKCYVYLISNSRAPHPRILHCGISCKLCFHPNPSGWCAVGSLEGGCSLTIQAVCSLSFSRFIAAHTHTAAQQPPRQTAIKTEVMAECFAFADENRELALKTTDV